MVQESGSGVRLGDVTAVLDRAYPPHLAQDWDAVGLVCGDPDQRIGSVTVAVDATAAVVAQVPPGGLLLAHHPLLLRGVQTVAADTPKGAVLHRLLERGAALFTAHTNADAAFPGVSDALADVLGLRVEGVLDPVDDPTRLDKWVVFTPAEHTAAVADALFAAGAGQIGDYARCSWTSSGTGRFLPRAGARPAIGRIGSEEQVPEDRLEVIAPAAGRAAVLAALRASHPYEEPAFDVLALAALPAGCGLGRIAVLPEPETLAQFASRVAHRLPPTTWGVRAGGWPGATVQRVALCGGAGDSLLSAVAAAGVDAYLTADLRHHPADEHLRRSGVALVDVSHWASEQPWCQQAADVLGAEFGARLPVRVSDLRTDPWNVDISGGEQQ